VGENWKGVVTLEKEFGRQNPFKHQVTSRGKIKQLKNTLDAWAAGGPESPSSGAV
jgi:hypothetical protein